MNNDEVKQVKNVLWLPFEYYEASAVSYLGLKKGQREPGKKIDYYREMAKKRYVLVDDFEVDPVLRHPNRFDKNEKLKMLRW